MNKQTKIIEHQKLEQLRYGKPEINARSREIAISDKNRVPIYERPVAKEGLQGSLLALPKNITQEFDEEKKRESRERIREFLDRNYQRHMQKVNRGKETAVEEKE